MKRYGVSTLFFNMPGSYPEGLSTENIEDYLRYQVFYHDEHIETFDTFDDAENFIMQHDIISSDRTENSVDCSVAFIDLFDDDNDDDCQEVGFFAASLAAIQ